MNLTDERTLTFGLEWAGCKTVARLGEERKRRRFIGMYGLPPIVWRMVFDDLKNTELVPVELGVANLRLKELLVTAHWLKDQATYENLATSFGWCEATIQKKVWKVTRAIAHLRAHKVRRFEIFNYTLVSLYY